MRFGNILLNFKYKFFHTFNNLNKKSMLFVYSSSAYVIEKMKGAARRNEKGKSLHLLSSSTTYYLGFGMHAAKFKIQRRKQAKDGAGAHARQAAKSLSCSPHPRPLPIIWSREGKTNKIPDCVTAAEIRPRILLSR